MKDNKWLKENEKELIEEMFDKDISEVTNFDMALYKAFNEPIPDYFTIKDEFYPDYDTTIETKTTSSCDEDYNTKIVVNTNSFEFKKKFLNKFNEAIEKAVRFLIAADMFIFKNIEGDFDIIATLTDADSINQIIKSLTVDTDVVPKKYITVDTSTGYDYDNYYIRIVRVGHTISITPNTNIDIRLDMKETDKVNHALYDAAKDLYNPSAKAFKGNDKTTKNEKEIFTMDNNQNKFTNAHQNQNGSNNNDKEILGVEYVNTTHEDYMMRYIKDGTLRPFDVSGEKVEKYTRSLVPHPDYCFKPHVDEKDKDKKYGVIYYFPHYIIKSDCRIEPDVIDTDMVDITHICDYPDDTIVLINKEDMNCNGFKRYILDTRADMLSCLNKLKIKFSEDPERFTAYRQMMTMVQFINKYNKYIHISPNNDTKWVLVHTLHSIDNGGRKYREYRIVTLDGPGIVTTDIRVKNPCVLNNTTKDDNSKSESDSNDCTCNAISDVVNNIMSSDEQFKNVQEISNEVYKIFGTGIYKINITRLDNYPVDDDGNVISSDDCYDIVIEYDNFNDIKFFDEFSLETEEAYSKIYDIIRKFESDNEQFKNAEVGARFRLEFTIPGNNPDSIFKKLKIDGWNAKKTKGKLSTYVFDVYIEKDKNIQFCSPDIIKKHINRKK